MRVSEFRELVGRASGLGGDNDFVRAAVEGEAEERGELCQERAQAVAGSARERASNWIRASRSSEDAGEALRAESDLNPEAVLVSKALAKRLELWAEGLREEGGFGSREAPFRDEAEAADWIEEQSARDRKRGASRRPSPADAAKEIRRLADLAGMEVEPKPRFLKYGRPKDLHTRNTLVCPGTFLDRLARETNRVSEKTAFQPDVLTAFVLTGLQPLISRVRITQTEKTCDVPGDRIPSRWVTLRFNTADITYDEVRSLYAEIRAFFGATNTERLSWPEADFISLVDSMGGPPKQGKTRFWEEVLRLWREEPASQHSPLSSWRAARNKFERLDEQKNVRELTTPNPPLTLAELKHAARAGNNARQQSG